ncbi:MAG TPA: hypothetical protein VLJ10_00895, partial [Candidatus Bathyarchaeia archaeon]|nr:hypothetical protein [Candidatus Bathyarchaeia archaeon]
MNRWYQDGVRFMQNLKCTNTRLFRESFWPFFGAFVLWCFAFRGFLLDQYPLIEDAISYINNSKYLIDHYLKGRIPLWTNAFYGLPYDFFLSRLGSNNPLYLVIAGLYGLGLPFIFSYLWALAGYYFLGCVGFFMLARRLTDDWLASFFGFLILYFSSLGTRMFDSFIVRLFVPLAWFFYFLAAFFQQPCRKNFLGLVFTSMLLVSTYVPFYFGILVILCVVLFFLLFPSRGVEHVKTLAAFVRKEKWLMVIGVCVLIIALLPGI